jgi:hypothetical protein
MAILVFGLKSRVLYLRARAHIRDILILAYILSLYLKGVFYEHHSYDDRTGAGKIS